MILIEVLITYFQKRKTEKEFEVRKYSKFHNVPHINKVKHLKDKDAFYSVFFRLKPLNDIDYETVVVRSFC